MDMHDDFLKDLRKGAFSGSCAECRDIGRRYAVRYPDDDYQTDRRGKTFADPENEFCPNCGRLFKTVALRVSYD